MIKGLRKIHNKKFYNNDRAEGLPIESKEFEGIARYIIFEDEMAITTKNDGVLTGNMGQLEKLFKEALNVIEIYRRDEK
ncbi:hypothetical protein [Acetobacterium sp.]|uniref:hypothetical protein n=1 Tax=Acetobacterium sp. TaxID=1872094 RepID=UPI002723E216|nr:hypothetical protein [Acetobacterium sp.]MDO9492824.1 hypothetical protein [Acetobacterium sp.]